MRIIPSTSGSTTDRKSDHRHTPEEILAVRSSLLSFVPTELADLILDEAKYWSKATWSFKPKDRVVLDSKSNGGDNATFCCLLTPKLCDLLYSGVNGVVKMKSVCFKIASYDLHRAWRDERNFTGAYEGSYTWFEAVIVREIMYKQRTTGPSYAQVEIEWIRQALNFRADYKKYPHCEVVTVKTPNDQNSDTWNIQRNKRAATITPKRTFELHTVVWTAGEEAADESILMDKTGRGSGRGFVSSLMNDDRIAVMARAKCFSYNYINSVELEVYYSV